MVEKNKGSWLSRNNPGVMPDFSSFSVTAKPVDTAPTVGHKVSEAEEATPGQAAIASVPALPQEQPTAEGAAVEAASPMVEVPAQIEGAADYVPDTLPSETELATLALVNDAHQGEGPNALPAEPESHKKKGLNLTAFFGRFKRTGVKPKNQAVEAATGVMVSVEQMQELYASAERKVDVPTLTDVVAGAPAQSVAVLTPSVEVSTPLAAYHELSAQVEVPSLTEVSTLPVPVAQGGDAVVALEAGRSAAIDEVLVAPEAPPTTSVDAGQVPEAGAQEATDSALAASATVAGHADKQKRKFPSIPGFSKPRFGLKGKKEKVEAESAPESADEASMVTADQAEIHRFTAVPIRALFGYLPDVRESDALEYALGYAAEFLQQQGMVFYDAFPFKRGYAFEVQQGGDGKAFLPEIIEYFNSQGEFEPGEDVRVVIKTATRKAEVFRTREGLDFVILPEGSEKPVTSWLTGSSKLTPAINRKTGFFVVSAAIFATGFVAMLFSSMLTRYQGTEPMPTPKEEFVSLADTPSGQWNNLLNVPPNSYVKALRFKNGKWEPLEVTVDLELVKPRSAPSVAAEPSAEAPVTAPVSGVVPSATPTQASNGAAR